MPAPLPLAIDVASGSPVEVRPVLSTLEARLVPGLPERLIGDKAATRKIKTQGGRPLRRYERRWKIERLFARLHNFRRLVTRWECEVLSFLGFVQPGCIVILPRRYL